MRKLSVDVPLANRMQGAIWGAFVGDAACMGSHWIYDLTELAKTFPDGLHGFEGSRPGHYHYGKKPGELTHYGDAALLMLDSLAETGHFDAVDFGRRFIALMTSADYAGYRDHATKDTITRYCAFTTEHPDQQFDYQQGADDDQPATVTRLAPVVVAHWQDKGLMEVVATVTRVSQDNERSIAYAQAYALILWHLLAGAELEEAAEQARDALVDTDPAGSEVAAKIEAALATKGRSITEATLGFGQSCPLASSFPAALYAAMALRDDMANAILATARAGGDNAARSAMIGGWLGARLGFKGVPEAWRSRLAAREAIERNVGQLVGRVIFKAA